MEGFEFFFYIYFIFTGIKNIGKSQFTNCGDLADDEMQHRDASSTVYLSLSIIWMAGWPNGLLDRR